MLEVLKSRYTAIAAFIAINVFNWWLGAHQATNPAEWAAAALVSGASISLLLGKSILTWKDDTK